MENGNDQVIGGNASPGEKTRKGWNAMETTKKASFFSREKDEQMDRKLWEKFHSPEGKAKRRKNIRIGMCVTLVILLLASLLNWGVITGWGNVRIDRLKLLGTDGAEYSALVYVPKNATNDTPAPAILMFHGNAGNARNHESWAVEFSRRGFVVLSVDQFGAGNSQGHFSNALSEESLTSVAELYTQYLLTMPIVDKENILTSGHSMGTTAAVAMGAKYGAKLIISASPVIILDEEGDYAKMWAEYAGNFVASIGAYESSEEENKADGLSWLQVRDSEATEFEMDTLYGSFEEGNALIYMSEQRIHEAAFVDQTAIGHIVKYAQECVGQAVPNYIPDSDQVWMYKDYTGLFGIFAFGAFVCALALFLIEEVEFFQKVKRPIARNIGLRGIGMAISLVLGVVFPVIVLKTDALGIIGGRFYKNLEAAGFKMGYANMAFGTVIGLNLLGVLGFLLFAFTDGRRAKMKGSDLGLTPEGYETLEGGGAKAKAILLWIVRTSLLSAVVVAIAWGYVMLQNTVLGTDFYGWFFGVKDVPLNKIPYYMNYMVLWIICFTIAAFTLNIERRLPTTGNETLDVVLQMLFNIVMGTVVLIVVVAVKWHLQTIGSAADKGLVWKMGVDTQRLWGMPVGMTVGIGGSTFLYKKTGNTWLSAILMGTVACLMCVTFGGSRFHF